MKNLISIENLSVGYNKPIIEGINIATRKNKLIAIIGRNGVGKSTLIKTLSGLIPEINGCFKTAGKNIFLLNENEKAKILSVVTTKPTDIYNITVYDYIGFGRYPYNSWLGIMKNNDQSIIEHAIKKCDIQHLTERNYDTLSDGEKQRVNIARAITQETPIIILDEPTAHLDIVNKIEVFKLLKQLTKEYSKTIILSTHHIEYALQVCDEIWTIHNHNLTSFKPKELVESKLIESIMDNEHITFDSETKTFKIK